ncbi:MAG: hypothetical protein M1812_005845 [Candelaria pacifica]|nr:MAG: hypothetical protein M1812_005845 [Candelaria pacifica]
MQRRQDRFLGVDKNQGSIPAPVDLRSGSRLADEKRKPNANASSQFRRRQKFNENELLQKITKLERQLQGTNWGSEYYCSESHYYRLERDYFRVIAYSTPNHAPTAQWPHLLRHRTQLPIIGTEYPNSSEKSSVQVRDNTFLQPIATVLNALQQSSTASSVTRSSRTILPFHAEE